MKKNWTLRAGVLMLALTLITSCFVGGTFAKYTTNGTGADSARVAKFGVDVEGTGTTFSNEYAADDGTYNGVTVKSDVKVVAPGTKGTMAAVTFTGTPEVAVKVTYDATVALTGNWVAKAAPEAAETYYCPLKITIGSETLYGMDYDNADAFAAAMKGAIDAYSKEYAPGTNLSAQNAADVLDISWAWDFEGTDNKQTDMKDTYLGDKAAEDVDNAGTISLTVTATVTQIN